MTSQLKISGFTCEREGRLLISELDLLLSPGELLQIAGKNGTGKTTLMRSVVGLFTGYEGTITWQGADVRKRPWSFTSQLCFLGHQAGVNTTLTPMENLLAWCGIHPAQEGVSPGEALERVGLGGFQDVPCYSLSAGQQRRVAVARLWLTGAIFWVLDEPFTALDRSGVKQLEELLLEHTRGGGTVLMTTHHKLGWAVDHRQLELTGEGVVND